MGFLSFFRRKAAPPTTALTLGDYGMAAIGSMDVYGRQAAPSARGLVEENLGTAWACQNMNSDGTASVPLRLYIRTPKGKKPPAMRRWDGSAPISKAARRRLIKAVPEMAQMLAGDAEVDEVVEHPLLDLLRMPNSDAPECGIFDFLWTLNAYLDTVGRFHIYVERGGAMGMPSRLWILAAHEVTEVPDTKTHRVIEKYEYGWGAGRKTYRPEEIVTGRFPDLRNPLIGGMSPLRAAIEHVKVMRKLDAHTSAILDNGARPDAMFTPKGDESGLPIGVDEANRLQAKLNQKFQRGGRGSVMVSEVPGMIHMLQWPMRDLADLKQFDITKTVIANAYGVPDSKLNRNSANRASAETADYAHAKDAVVPRCRRIASALQNLCRIYDPSGRLFLAFDSPLEDSIEIQLKMDDLLVKSNAMLRNELRQKYGMEPLPEMDEMQMSKQYMLMREIDANIKNGAMRAAEPDPETPNKDKDDEDDPKDAE